MKAIAFKQAGKSFLDGDAAVTALKKTEFFLEKRKFTAVIGPSG
ncbi:hypothetical protein [Enterococcus sp. BWB1-3]